MEGPGWRHRSATGSTSLLGSGLYVDDERANRQLLARLFSRYRPDDLLLLAGSGQAPWIRVRASPIDLVLLDLTLPDMSGEEVLLTVRPERSIPVVIISGHDGPATADHLHDLGVSAYVTKPFEAEDLFSLIEGLLD